MFDEESEEELVARSECYDRGHHYHDSLDPRYLICLHCSDLILKTVYEGKAGLSAILDGKL